MCELELEPGITTDESYDLGWKKTSTTTQGATEIRERTYFSAKTARTVVKEIRKIVGKDPEAKEIAAKLGFFETKPGAGFFAFNRGQLTPYVLLHNIVQLRDYLIKRVKESESGSSSGEAASMMLRAVVNRTLFRLSNIIAEIQADLLNEASARLTKAGSFYLAAGQNLKSATESLTGSEAKLLSNRDHLPEIMENTQKLKIICRELEQNIVAISVDLRRMSKGYAEFSAKIAKVKKKTEEYSIERYCQNVRSLLQRLESDLKEACAKRKTIAEDNQQALAKADSYIGDLQRVIKLLEGQLTSYAGLLSRCANFELTYKKQFRQINEKFTLIEREFTTDFRIVSNTDSVVSSVENFIAELPKHSTTVVSLRDRCDKLGKIAKEVDDGLVVLKKQVTNLNDPSTAFAICMDAAVALAKIMKASIKKHDNNFFDWSLRTERRQQLARMFGGECFSVSVDGDPIEVRLSAAGLARWCGLVITKKSRKDEKFTYVVERDPKRYARSGLEIINLMVFNITVYEIIVRRKTLTGSSKTADRIRAISTEMICRFGLSANDGLAALLPLSSSLAKKADGLSTTTQVLAGDAGSECIALDFFADRISKLQNRCSRLSEGYRAINDDFSQLSREFSELSASVDRFNSEYDRDCNDVEKVTAALNGSSLMEFGQLSGNLAEPLGELQLSGQAFTKALGELRTAGQQLSEESGFVVASITECTQDSAAAAEKSKKLSDSLKPVVENIRDSSEMLREAKEHISDAGLGFKRASQELELLKRGIYLLFKSKIHDLIDVLKAEFDLNKNAKQYPEIITIIEHWTEVLNKEGTDLNLKRYNDDIRLFINQFRQDLINPALDYSFLHWRIAWRSLTNGWGYTSVQKDLSGFFQSIKDECQSDEDQKAIFEAERQIFSF